MGSEDDFGGLRSRLSGWVGLKGRAWVWLVNLFDIRDGWFYWKIFGVYIWELRDAEPHNL